MSVGAQYGNLDELLLRTYDAGFISENENLNAPFLSMIERNTDVQFNGADFRFGVGLDGNETGGYSTENAQFGAPIVENTDQAVVTPKVFRWPGRVSGLALATARGKGAFAEVLSQAMSKIVKRASHYREMAQFQTGTGQRGVVSSVSGQVITLTAGSQVSAMLKNRFVVFYTSGTYTAGPVQITKSDWANNQITVSGDISAVSGSDTIHMDGVDPTLTATANEITGLPSLTSDGTYRSVDSSAHAEWESNSITVSAEITADTALRLQNRIEATGGIEDQSAFKWVFGLGQRRQIQNLGLGQQRFTGVNASLGFTDYELNGVPCMFVYSCPDTDGYLGDWSQYQRFVVGDLQFGAHEGQVLKWATNYDAIFFYLVGYEEFSGRKRNAFGRLASLSAPASR